MKKRLIFAIAVIFMTAQITVAQPVTNPVNAFERPLLRVGNSCSDVETGWGGVVVERKTLTITAVHEDGYEAVARSDITGGVSRVMLTSDLNIVEYGAVRYSPHSGNHNFPLDIGKKWKTEYSYLILTNGAHGTSTTSAEVVGMEDITVPAGRFTTLKIVYLTYANGSMADNAGSWEKINKTVWYDYKSGCEIRMRYEKRNKFNVLANYGMTELTALKVN